MFDTYTSPLATRGASPWILYLWSPSNKFSTWRRLWYVLANEQSALGIKIPPESLEDFRRSINITDDEIKQAAVIESRVQHDVMAHILCLKENYPNVGPYIHMGETSQFVVDNADLLLIRDSLNHLLRILKHLLINMSSLAIDYKHDYLEGLTHLMPAQPITFGRRMAMWAHDLAIGYEELKEFRDNLKCRGTGGATGTHSAACYLFDDPEKALELDKRVASALEFKSSHVTKGQTYPRIIDCQLISKLGSIAACMGKVSSDIRLMVSRGELSIIPNKASVGSSAMPHKVNPIKAEKVSGLARLLIGHVTTIMHMAANQWAERTLDDSIVKRVVVPESFIIVDIMINTMIQLISTVRVNKQDNMSDSLLMEPILMQLCKAGHDRQHWHDILKRHCYDDLNIDKLNEYPEVREILENRDDLLKYITGASARQVEMTRDYISSLT